MRINSIYRRALRVLFIVVGLATVTLGLATLSLPAMLQTPPQHGSVRGGIVYMLIGAICLGFAWKRLRPGADEARTRGFEVLQHDNPS